MRRCIKEPIPEIYDAWEAMSAAVDEHITGNFAHAEELFRKADCPVVYEWLSSSWVGVSKNVVETRPDGDSIILPKAERDPDRNIIRPVREQVLKRDGYRCRYCGIPVVHADIRKRASVLYPSSVRWDSRDPGNQHAGFQCLWLQFDHVVPHSHGGRSTAENVVISCALCNFGKDRFTLRQLHLEDPRQRKPEPMGYDGLERLRTRLVPPKDQNTPEKPVSMAVSNHRHQKAFARYFLPGAWISSGYLNTQEIAGKKRWFKLGEHIQAEPVERGGIDGCILVCRPEELVRRGIEADRLLDHDDLEKT